MKRLIALITAFALIAPVAALAATASVKVSPANVKAGKTVTVSGSVGSGCQTGKGSTATIYSKAFKSKHNFAGTPSVSASLDTHGKFSVKVKIRKKASGSYKVAGRCGGGKFASTTLKVSSSSSGGGGNYGP